MTSCLETGAQARFTTVATLRGGQVFIYATLFSSSVTLVLLFVPFKESAEQTLKLMDEAISLTIPRYN